MPLAPRPNADFLRGLLGAYALSLAWLNAQGFWLGLGLWAKYHRYVPLQVWAPAAILAAALFVAAALAFPGPRRLLAAALLLTAGAVLPVAFLAAYWQEQPATGFLLPFAANEAVRAGAAGAAWWLFRRAGKGGAP